MNDNSEHILFEKSVSSPFRKKENIVLTEDKLFLPVSGLTEVYYVDNMVDVEINPLQREIGSFKNVVSSLIISFFSFWLALILYNDVLYIVSILSALIGIFFFFITRPKHSISIYLENGRYIYYSNKNKKLIEELTEELEIIIEIVNEERAERERKRTKQKELLAKRIEGLLR